MKKNIEDMLFRTTPKIDETQKSVLWNKIETDLNEKKSIVSPYFSTKQKLAAGILMLSLIFGVSGTTVMANAARPGDTLFFIDKAVEDVRLAIATDEDKKNSLKILIAEERLHEMQSILEERDFSADTSDNEARILQTIKMVEEITNGLEEGVKNNLREKSMRYLNTGKFRLEEKSDYEEDEEIRLEMRDGEDRLKIETKDGEMRVRSEEYEEHQKFEDRFEIESEEQEEDLDDDEKDYVNGNEDNVEEKNEDSQIKIEAKVENGKAEVRTEVGENRAEFELVYTTTDELVSAIATRLNLSIVTVASHLDLEIDN